MSVFVWLLLRVSKLASMHLEGNIPRHLQTSRGDRGNSDESENALACGHFSNERSGAPIEIDSEKVYDLKELIDIAEQQVNPAMSENSNAFIWQVFLLMSALTKGLVFGPIS